MISQKLVGTTVALVLTAGLGAAAFAQPVTDIGMGPEDSTFGRKEYSPYLNQHFPQRVFWGETHVHTAYSTDSGLFGTRLTPDDAYRFAKGEEVVSSTGVRARIIRPLAIGVQKTTIIGGRPWKFGVQYWHYLESPDLFGQDWQIRFSVSPVVKLPW